MDKKGMVQGARRCLVAQLIISVSAAGSFWLAAGVEFFYASLYGGLLGMLNTFILARRINHGRSAGDLAVHAKLGLFERLAVAVVFLALAFLKLGLLPIPLILTMVLTYFGYLFAGGSLQAGFINGTDTSDD